MVAGGVVVPVAPAVTALSIPVEPAGVVQQEAAKVAVAGEAAGRQDVIGWQIPPNARYCICLL